MRTAFWRRRTALVAGVVLSGSLLLQGVASAAPRDGNEDWETVDLPNGQHLVLPYKKLPGDAWFRGLPGDGAGTIDTVDWATAQKAFPDWGRNDPDEFAEWELYHILQKKFPDLYDVDGAVVKFHRHKNYHEGNLWYQAMGMTLPNVCKTFGHCAFVGYLTQKAPVVLQSDFVQGPESMTLTTQTSQTHSRSTTSGWSVGGEIGVSMSPSGGGAGGSGKGSFNYSTSATDSDSYTNSSGASYTRNIPEHKWGYEQVRTVGGQYTGFVAYPTPDPDGHGVGLYPVTVTIKAPGDLPSVSRNAVLVDDHNGGQSQQAKDIEKKISTTYTELASASAADRRTLQNTLKTLESQLDAALKGTGQKTEPAQLG